MRSKQNHRFKHVSQVLMQKEPREESKWDLRPVIDVIQALKGTDDTNSADKFGSLNWTDVVGDDSVKYPYNSHGDTDFDFLEFGGVPLDLPSASILSWGPSTPPPESKPANFYTSDGAVGGAVTSKDPQWMSEGDAAPDASKHILPSSLPVDSNLTKNQRKKRNRRLRHAEAAEAARRRQDDNEGNDGDDDDSGRSNDQSQKLQKPHAVAAKPDNEKELHVQANIPSKPLATATNPKKDSAIHNVPPATPQTIQQAKARVAAAISNTPITATKYDQTPKSAKANHQTLKRHWPTQDSYVSQIKKETTSNVVSFDPFTVQVNYNQPEAHSLPFGPTQSHDPTHSKHEIMPLTNWTSVERNWSLLSKLLTNFPEDRKYLVAPLQLSINRPQKKGIHVFVDASNILIGFYDHLKLARGIPKETRVKRVDLNFHALALLLERRRPVAKRVLAGSMPEVPAFEQARQVGYETCILEKVFKTPFSSEKKKKYRSLDNPAGLGYVSGSESAGNGLSQAENLPQAPAKWVEQAVDEVLHKKILESIVDVQVPSDAVSSYELGAVKTAPSRPTMILATGDAADAEYGSGFKDTVKRALKSGWMVEVMAFSKNISQDYRRMDKLPQARGGWGERFKIIELDPYAEELFGEGLEAIE